MTNNAVNRYLEKVDRSALSPAALAFYATIDSVGAQAPSIAASIVQELADQRSNVKLIASENYCSLPVQLAQGTLLTDKYAEGYPHHRFYAGCDNVDAIETEAADLAKALFGADHAYVQPHSGADANLVAFLSILNTRIESPALAELGEKNVAKLNDADWAQLREKLNNQRLLGMDYYSGGHLTHGYRLNVSARMFEAHSYTVGDDNLLDMAALREQVRAVRPLILLAGYSAYSRKINFAAMREIADDVNAVFMVDMAHFAGLVAGKVFAGDYDPVAHAHVVTTTTHKTLRGPRGGMVLCKDEFAEAVNKGCPIVLGGPLPHAMAAKAVAFREASQPEFADYAQRIVSNSQELAAQLMQRNVQVLTGGTDNHLLLVDVTKTFGITGRQAESALRACGITLNRNSLPFDANGPWFTSGLRLGTPAVTTLGMGHAEMAEIADVVNFVLANTSALSGPDGSVSKAKFHTQESIMDEARKRMTDLMGAYPVYPEIDLGLVAEYATA